MNDCMFMKEEAAETTGFAAHSSEWDYTSVVQSDSYSGILGH